MEKSASRTGGAWLLRVAGAVVLGGGVAVAASPAAAAVPMWSMAGQPEPQRVGLTVSADPSTAPEPGERLTYTVELVNSAGLTGAGWRLHAPVPTGFVDVDWTCVASGDGSACGDMSGTGDLDQLVDVAGDGGRVTYLVSGVVDPDEPVPFTFAVTLSPPAGGDCGRGRSPDPSSEGTEPVRDETSGKGGPERSWDQEKRPTHGYAEKPTRPAYRGEPCLWEHTVTPADVPSLPVTGASATLLVLVGAGAVVAGGAFLWWADRRRQLRRLLRAAAVR